MRECSFRKNETDSDGKPKLSKRTNGYFHQWGLDYANFGDGTINYSVAIVEDLYGQTYLVVPITVQFAQ